METPTKMDKMTGGAPMTQEPPFTLLGQALARSTSNAALADDLGSPNRTSWKDNNGHNKPTTGEFHKFKMGVPPVIIHLQMNFPEQKPSIYRWNPYLWKPPHEDRKKNLLRNIARTLPGKFPKHEIWRIQLEKPTE